MHGQVDLAWLLLDQLFSLKVVTSRAAVGTESWRGSCKLTKGLIYYDIIGVFQTQLLGTMENLFTRAA